MTSGSLNIEVGAFGPEDWRAYRDLRLAALADAPDAFGSTLERERALDESDWRRRLSSGNLAIHALVEGVPAGLAGGLRPGVYDGDPASTAAHLVSMWTHPSMRGRGVGAALVARVIEWARAERFPELRLWVVEGNATAERLYARMGFVDTGARAPVRPDDPRLEVEMALMLISDGST
ncbi:MAG: GNAT family N-acetyltransferase [Dehalococcoidia bacterium]